MFMETLDLYLDFMKFTVGKVDSRAQAVLNGLKSFPITAEYLN